MGTNEITLCGNEMLFPPNQLSSNGLKMTFCSDNKHTAKGFQLIARRLGESLETQKREVMIIQVSYNCTGY